VKNHVPIGRCKNCGLGRAEVENFDPGSYYTEAYFSGGHTDGYADYAGSRDAPREFRTRSTTWRNSGCRADIFEIGAYGFFLKSEGVSGDGIEISEAAAMQRGADTTFAPVRSMMSGWRDSRTSMRS
jgi:hypothetical protein